MSTATLAAEAQPLEQRQPEADQQARADSYRLIGTLLAAAPSAELLDLLRALQIPENEPSSAGRDSIAPAWAALQNAAQQATPEALERDYWRLFIGLGRGELVPYSSWYLTGYLMEEPLAILRGELAKLGFSRHQDSGEPEDHVAALCEVMAELITTDSTPNQQFGQQQQFFTAFIQPWMSRCFDDLAAIDDAPFYAAIGRLGATFMAIEQRYFAMSV